MHGCDLRNAIVSLKKRKTSRCCSESRPIEPGDLVVLVVRVVVAVLRVQELIAGHDHRETVGEHEQRDEVLCRRRNASTASDAFASPSTPQFQLRLSSVPSRLPWPLVSLCLRS